MTSQNAEILARIHAYAERVYGPTNAPPAPPAYVRQAPVFTPKPLVAYATVPGAFTWPSACPRCLKEAEQWIVRVFAEWREVRLCRACWAQWDKRARARRAA